MEIVLNPGWLQKQIKLVKKQVVEWPEPWRNEMPCTDGGPTYEQVAQEKIDGYAKMLCETMGRVEEYDNIHGTNVYGFLIKYNTKLSHWWKEHKEIDKKRIAKEQEQAKKEKLKKQALKKLTKEERQSLGL